jgi:hypothetical protein
MAGFEFVRGLFCPEIDKPFSDQLVRRSAIFTKRMVFLARSRPSRQQSPFRDDRFRLMSRTSPKSGILRQTVSSVMTVHAPKLLTPEEFASLIEVAISSPNPTIPASHLAKLVTLGYVAVTAKGPIVTGDGLVRITESE